MIPGNVHAKGDRAGQAVSQQLARFADARSQARRSHAGDLGAGVDPYRCLGDFLLLVSDRDDALLEKRYGSVRTKAALSAEGGGATGGYLVPATLRDDLMGDLAQEALIRPRAIVVPVTSDTLDLPVWDATTAQGKGIAPFWGGMQMQWVAEAQNLPESEPALRQLHLQMHELGGTLLVSAILQQDAKGLEAWLRLAFARSLAWYEDYSFVNAAGAGLPVGFQNSGCAISVTRGTGGQYSAGDGQKMFAQFYNGRSPSALWLLSVTALGDLTAQANWRTNGPMEQYGIPVVGTLYQPPLGTAGDVLLVDCAQYVIGDRQALEIAASPYAGTAFQNNQWMWRIVERIDGQMLPNAPITVPDGAGTANTVSPVVKLQ